MEVRRLNSFAAVRAKRKKPEFKNCSVTDEVYEEENLIHSFALKVTYIGLDSKMEIMEYLWGKSGMMNPKILEGAIFENDERKDDFRLPDEILERIKKKATDEEKKFHEKLGEERERTLKHLERMKSEKEREEKYEEAKRIEEEIERRKRAKLPDLRVKVEPVALLSIDAPVEIHHTKLENDFARKEITWKFDNLTGEHNLRCEGCGKKTDELFLTVDGLACRDCYKECKECGKPMINAYECKVCHAPLCDEHVHFCSTCHKPICKEHATKCEFCSNEMCPEHVHHCSICNAPLCEEHTYKCVVCGREIGPRHTRVCDVCGGNVCPEHIHKCEITGKNVCENCATEIDGKWYSNEVLEKGYGGKMVLPEFRCKTCGIAVSREDVQFCEVCNAPLCPDHAHHCGICGKTLCEDHVNKCSICGKELCGGHSILSELSGKVYCEAHATKCEVCGRVVGVDEIENGVCNSCRNMVEIERRDVPKEIFAKFPYAKKGKKWKISKGKNVAYITEVKGITLSYRVVDGKIEEFRTNKISL